MKLKTSDGRKQTVKNGYILWKNMRTCMKNVTNNLLFSSPLIDTPYLKGYNISVYLCVFLSKPCGCKKSVSRFQEGKKKKEERRKR